VRSAGGEKRTPLLAAPGIDILTAVPREAYDSLSGGSLDAVRSGGLRRWQDNPPIALPGTS
jgi:hypothetical protein